MLKEEIVNLPDEMILEIYNHSDFKTRKNINKIKGWSYYVKNPLEGIWIKPRRIPDFLLERLASSSL